MMVEINKNSLHSGSKYKNNRGIVAIKDGVKKNNSITQDITLKKPDWFKVKLPQGENFNALKNQVHRLNLSTVCEESKCPNIGECWNHKTATLMLMGKICTRACRFCSVDTGNPKGWLDPYEPINTARTVQFMNLDYVVLTSVDRDDLDDGGSSHIAKTVIEIRSMNPEITIEVLSPDFKGDLFYLDAIIESGLDVYSHNIETVERLTPTVRDPRAGYDQTLTLLNHARKNNVIVKSGMMLGLGESRDEVITTMKDLKTSGVSILTMGQYLSPTQNHIPVDRYVAPKEFKDYERIGRSIGIDEVVAGPLVRSSYRAERAFYNYQKRQTNVL